MVRTARWMIVSVLAVAVIGVAGISYACDSEKASATADNASVSDVPAPVAEKASASGCSSKALANCSSKASATAFAGIGCSKKALAAKADCDACGFVAQLKANKDKVTVSTVSNKDGVTLVFAAVTKDDVPVAKEVASQAYSLMSAPAHCAYTRAKMADKSCDGCATGFGAFADAAVTMEETDNGAETMVVTKNEEQVQKLLAFVSSFNVEDEQSE